MKITKIFIFVLLLLPALYSCRQESDYIPSYSGTEGILLSGADTSFTKQFEALWTAINTNYAAWEIETVDWDEVRHKYRPRFVELDGLKSRNQVVDDKDFENLYHEILDPLHDGHCKYTIRNLTTGTYITIAPSMARNALRFGKYANAVKMDYNIEYYRNEPTPQEERFEAFSDAIVSCSPVISQYLTAGIQQLNEELSKATTEEEQTRLAAQIAELEQLYNSVYSFPPQAEAQLIGIYNQKAATCHDARMPLYDTQIPDNLRIRVMSAISNDGIAYMRFSGYQLTYYLTQNPDIMPNATDAAIVRSVWNAYNLWFDNIQKLHAEGKLKGVIIDVRCNGGGSNTDQACVQGALLPSGGYKAGTYKMKAGTGRLDYSVDYDFISGTAPFSHEVIDDVPVIALCDHLSGSNAEITSIIVKQMPNGVVVGSQTYGAMSCIDLFYPHTNSGVFGKQNETSIYGFQPTSLISYPGYGSLEGIGVTPSEGYNLEFDTQLYAAEGRDNQLEAALSCIRKK